MTNPSLSSVKQAAIGTVKFLKSAWLDKHIVAAIKEIAKLKKTTPTALEAEINKKVAKFNDVAKYSTILYETIAKNVIESETFNLLEGLDFTKSEKFDPLIFMQLVRVIKAEHSRFFPLRNFADSKHLYSPRWILVPNGEKQYDGIPTAAATADGRFIFNIKFMQQLMDYSHLKGILPKGKKYINNGGTFPPSYAYIEFLILHELMHYTQADFHYGKIFKDVSPKILNWVGDFRSNYELVKGGYEQLPIGLYSEHINYDRQKTYREMVDIVKTEMAKLPKSLEDMISDLLDKLGDEHGEGGGEGEGGEGGEPGEGKTEGDVDKASKEAKEKLGERKEGSGSEAELGKSEKTGQPGKGSITSSNSEFNKEKVKPRYSWKELISKAIKSASESEETYQKPNKKSITGAIIARAIGKAAVKPGEIVGQANIKLLVVVDSSGSMSGDLPKVYSNIEALLKTRSIDGSFLLMRFSDVHEEWACNIRTGIASKGNEKEKVSKVFSTTYGGGTQLTPSIVEDIKARHAKGYNVLLFSDADVLHADNLANLKAILAFKPFVIFDSKNTYLQAVKILKSMSYNISHL